MCLICHFYALINVKCVLINYIAYTLVLWIYGPTDLCHDDVCAVLSYLRIHSGNLFVILAWTYLWSIPRELFLGPLAGRSDGPIVMVHRLSVCHNISLKTYLLPQFSKFGTHVPWVSSDKSTGPLFAIFSKILFLIVYLTKTNYFKFFSLDFI